MKHLYRFGFLLLSWLTALTAFSQPLSPNPDYNTAPKHPRWVVKFAPLALLEPSNTIEFAAERVIAAHQSIQVAFGYGWQGIGLWTRSSRYTDYETWRVRAEWRYYWRQAPAPFGSYTAIEGFYKQENAFEHGAVSVGNNGQGSPQYYRQYTLPISKYIVGFNLKIGRQFPISADGRFVGDFYGGIGVKSRQIQEPDRPLGYGQYDSSLFDTSPFANIGNIGNISIAYGIKFGYTF